MITELRPHKFLLKALEFTTNCFLTMLSSSAQETQILPSARTVQSLFSQRGPPVVLAICRPLPAGTAQLQPDHNDEHKKAS